MGLKVNVVYVGYYGCDIYFSGDFKKVVIFRGVFIEKVLDDYSFIVWVMNGEFILLFNGYLLCLVFGGFFVFCLGKWLEWIVVCN